MDGMNCAWEAIFFSREKYLSKMQNKVEDKYKFKEEEIQSKSLCCRKGSLQPSSYCVFQTKGVRVGYRSSG